MKDKGKVQRNRRLVCSFLDLCGYLFKKGSQRSEAWLRRRVGGLTALQKTGQTPVASLFIPQEAVQRKVVRELLLD